MKVSNRLSAGPVHVPDYLKRPAGAGVVLASTSVFAVPALIESSSILEDQIPITTQYDRNRVVVMTVGPISAAAGALLDVRFQLIVSSEHRPPVMVGYDVRLSDAPGERPGHVVLPAVATNLDRARHHEILSGSRLHELHEPVEHVYVTLSLWAQRSQDLQGDITIEESGQFLQVRVVTPDS